MCGIGVATHEYKHVEHASWTFTSRRGMFELQVALFGKRFKGGDLNVHFREASRLG